VAPSVARLPYFDGDYWPGAIEEELQKIQKERDERGAQKKGKKAKAPAAPALPPPTTKRGSGFRGQAAPVDEADLAPGSTAAIGKQLMTKVSPGGQGHSSPCAALGLALRCQKVGPAPSSVCACSLARVPDGIQPKQGRVLRPPLRPPSLLCGAAWQHHFADEGRTSSWCTCTTAARTASPSSLGEPLGLPAVQGLLPL